MPKDFSVNARPFDFPYDGRLDPARAALLVIDLQVDFLASDGYFARKGYDPAPLRAILPAVSALLAAARAAGFLIVHTRQGYRADMADMTDYERWRRRRAGGAAVPLTAGRYKGGIAEAGSLRGSLLSGWLAMKRSRSRLRSRTMSGGAPHSDAIWWSLHRAHSGSSSMRTIARRRSDRVGRTP